MAAAVVHVRSPGPARARRLPRVGDERLVARVRAGDDTAFEIIYDRYYRGLLAFCGQMLGSRQEAEDALQHSFASAYRALRGGAGDIELRPWLYTIARNRCLSVHRAQRVQVSADGLAADFGSFEGMSAQVQLRADLRELVDELQRLPDDQRAALVLFELGDQSHAEIAAVLGVRREKVKALVFQAREALMRARDAAARPCVEIREELSTVAGRVPRRSVARRHIDRCPGCAEFEREVRRQRAAFAAILPLAPTVGLKASVLGFAVGGGGGAVALGGAGAGGGATVAAGGALAAGGVGSGIAGSAGAATAGAIGTAGAATVATGLATGGSGVGLASLSTKVVVAKILSVVALGGGGVQAQVHSDPPSRPAAIHQSVLRPVAPARVPTYPPAPERRVPAKAPAIQATASASADSPAAAPQAAAAPPASSAQPPAPSHAPAAPAPSMPASPAPSSSAAPAAVAATPTASDPPATTPAPASPAPANPPAGATAPPVPIASTATSAPAPVAAPAPAPTPVTSNPPATAPPTDGGAGTPATAAPAADTASAAAAAS
jgi:RNA polymerase sigma factor (sigma-70 family)